MKLRLYGKRTDWRMTKSAIPMEKNSQLGGKTGYDPENRGLKRITGDRSPIRKVPE